MTPPYHYNKTATLIVDEVMTKKDDRKQTFHFQTSESGLKPVLFNSISLHLPLKGVMINYLYDLF